MKKIVIAIDGYSACGKSTLAKQLADKLNYLFLDTGAMYRAVAYYFLKNNLNWKEKQIRESHFPQIDISFKTNIALNKQETYLNDENIESEIRTMQINNIVSEIAAYSDVRKFLVSRQQAIGALKGIVMDGRDIGTVVFPEAELKIFITAELETRIQRRYLELLQNGFDVTKKEIKENLLKRDLEETSRADSPLIKANDAILIDNTHLSPLQQLDKVYQLALKRTK